MLPSSTRKAILIPKEHIKSLRNFLAALIFHTAPTIPYPIGYSAILIKVLKQKKTFENSIAPSTHEWGEYEICYLIIINLIRLKDCVYVPSLRCKKCDTKNKKLLSGTFDSEYFAQTIWNEKYYSTGRCMEALQHIWSHQAIHPHRDVMWAAFGDAVITLFLTSILLCIVVYLYTCFLVYLQTCVNVY